MTEARYLERMVDQSRERIRDLSRVGGSSFSSGCVLASRNPGWLIAVGFAAAFVIGRSVLPRLPGGGHTRAAVGFVGGTLARVVRGQLVDALTPRGDG